MYFTDYREQTLTDSITKLEPDFFKAMTGLSVDDFSLLVSFAGFSHEHMNEHMNGHMNEHMNQAVFAFRRYEDASLTYTGIDSHEGLRSYGFHDTVVPVRGR